MTDVKRVAWMNDFLPDEHKYFTFLKKVYRHELRKNWYRRISTPLLEYTSILEKVYSGTDIMQKTIYSFIDDEGNALSLRSDAAIWILRAYIDWNLWAEIQPVYLYHIDRSFRKDYLWLTPWLKQFYTIWGEIIWEQDPVLDVQQIYINYKILSSIGLEGKYEVTINSFWNKKELEKYKEELRNFYENKKHLLSEESLKNLQENPLILLASSLEDEKILARLAPSPIKFLKKESKEYYSKMKKYLDILNIPYREDHTLVHLLQYYNNSVWKISLKETGESLVVGGRYDTMAQKMGYEAEIPASGFTVRVEKIIAMLKENNINIKSKDKIDLYFVQLGDEAKEVVLPLTLEAREKWINTLSSLGTPALKEQMLKAQRIGVKFVVMVWVMEARNGKFQVRNMEAGTQAEVKKEDLIEYIIEKIGREKLDFYDPAKELVMGKNDIIVKSEKWKIL